MIKILFICHGTICRSPIAEFVMKDIVKKCHCESDFEIASAATSTEEIGNPVYPPARKKLMEHGINPAGKTSRQMTKKDYDHYDYLIAMDNWNLRNMRRFVPEDREQKVRLLRDFTDSPGEIDDPWYTGDFETAYRQILAGCQGLFAMLTSKKQV